MKWIAGGAIVSVAFVIVLTACGSEAGAPGSGLISTKPQDATSDRGRNGPPAVDQKPVASKPTTSPRPTATPSPSLPAAVSPTAAPVPPADVVFVRDGNLWLAFVKDGRQIPLAMDGGNSSPKWSPDGRSIVFAHGGGASAELHVIGADGSARRRLMESSSPCAGALCSDPEWSPSGDAILFTVGRDDNKDGKVDERDVSEVWLVNADGSNPRKIAEGRNPTWAPEGLRIAFATLGKLEKEIPYRRANAVNLINRQGKNEWTLVSTNKVPAELTLGEVKLQSGVFLLGHPTWSPASKLISFTAAGHTGMILTINEKAADLRVLASNYEGGFGRSTWSPKGDWLAYESFPPSGVKAVGIGGPTVKTPVTIGGAHAGLSALSPTWSPDGGHLAFVQELGGTRYIATVRADGAGVRELATGNVSEPHWNPKGATRSD